MRIILPFPPPELSPNKRLHWAALSRARRKYRAACMMEARAQGAIKAGGCDSLAVHLIFHPPDRRHRDWDNMLAAAKSGLDGLSDALGVDDSRWRLSFEVSEKIIGNVEVMVTWCGD